MPKMSESKESQTRSLTDYRQYGKKAHDIAVPLMIFDVSKFVIAYKYDSLVVGMDTTSAFSMANTRSVRRHLFNRNSKQEHQNPEFRSSRTDKINSKHGYFMPKILFFW
jgi:hypothetical protein